MLSKIKSALPTAAVTVGIILVIKMFLPGVAAKLAGVPVVGILFR